MKLVSYIAAGDRFSDTILTDMDIPEFVQQLKLELGGGIALTYATDIGAEASARWEALGLPTKFRRQVPR